MDDNYEVSEREELWDERWALREMLWGLGSVAQDPEHIERIKRDRARLVELNQLLGA